MPSIPGYSM